MQSSLISLPKRNISIEIFTKVISRLVQIARSPILCNMVDANSFNWLYHCLKSYTPALEIAFFNY